MEIVNARITEVSTLIGLLLVLVTLFTSEQARAVDAERRREGGSTRGAGRRITAISLCLAVVTIVAVLSTAPLVWDVIKFLVDGDAEPVQAVFALVWLLLVPLAFWQLVIATAAHKLGR
jgi:hypothetical protein